MTPQYILTKSLCREPHCAHGENWKQRAQDEIENMNWASDYAEPGYRAGSRGVLLADWNYFPSNIDSTLERAGFDIQWSDEWDMCEDCGKLVRTSADCYDWQPSYVLMNECEIVCLACLDHVGYLESIEDNPDVACMRTVDPGQHGYQLVSESGEYANGFYPGQNDNPREIHKRLASTGHKQLVFRIGETSQFYIKFEVWERVEEESD